MAVKIDISSWTKIKNAIVRCTPQSQSASELLHFVRNDMATFIYVRLLSRSPDRRSPSSEGSDAEGRRQ